MYDTDAIGILTFLSAFLKIEGYGDLAVGIFASIQAVSSLLLRVVSGKYAEKHLNRMIFLGLTLSIVALLTLSIDPLPPTIYMVAVISGVSSGLLIPSLQVLALYKSSEGNRGFLSGIYATGYDAGNIIGPMLFGFLAEVYGDYYTVFKVAPVILIPATLLLAIIPNVSKYMR